MRKLLLLLTVFLFVCMTSPPEAADETASDVITLEPLLCTDTETGIQAFSILKPHGWISSDSVSWTGYSIIPAVTGIRMEDSDNHLAFEKIPSAIYHWDGDIKETETESFSKIAPPMTAKEYLEDYLLPDKLADLRYDIIETIALPDLSDIVAEMKAKANLPKSVSISVTSARSTVQYLEKDTTIQEDFYVVVTQIDTNTQTLDDVKTETTWSAEYQFSYKYPYDSYTQESPIFASIMKSLKFNPDWVSIGEQVAEKSDQVDSSDMNRIRPNVSRDTIDSLYLIYDAIDFVISDFCDYTKKTIPVMDPYLKTSVELPIGYTSIWTDTYGSYALSTDDIYDPNLDNKINDIKWDLLMNG